MRFPLQIGPGGAETSNRAAHVREQIEQVLFTDPGERVFRPDFGAGVRALIFEPNSIQLWELTRRRLTASLAEALRGEVDPKTLEVSVEGREEKLLVVVAYTLATIGHTERQAFLVSESGKVHG
jgi:phage baseplate assembly protein W